MRSLLKWLSRAKRDSFTLECVLRTFWDCKLGSILSRQLKRKRDFCRHEIEFFCDENVLNGWFFDIYIQGSKKYNFKS